MKAIKIALVAAAMGVATAANAWWGGPGYGNGFGDGFGDGSFGFNMSGSANTRAYGNGYGYNAPYYGYAPYGYAPYYGAPAAPVAPAPVAGDQQAAIDAHRKSADEFRQQMMEQQKAAYEAQKKAHEEYMAEMNKRFAVK
jgi:hypothetical protein